MKMYEGIRVVEFSTNIAAPTIGQWMVEYGAEVIHIERPVVGDDSRHYPPIVDNVSLQYFTLNHGKKSVVLDLKDPEGNQIARDLIAKADVLIESNRPGAMEKLGLGYDAMHELNPRLIYVSVSAWGHKGPYASQPGYDLIAQAASGLMYYNGDYETGPVRVFTEIGDYSAAIAGFGAVNAALFHRERTRIGQFVDISLVRTLASMSVKLDDYRIFHRETKKRGNQGSNLLCPYGCFKCPDGEYIVIACSNNNLCFQFFHLIGRDDLITDPRCATNDIRVENSDYLIPILNNWLQKMGTAKNAEKALRGAGLPCTRIYTYEDIDNDPHYQEAGWFAEIPVPPEVTTVQSRRIVGSPFTFSELTPEYQLGEHLGESNHEIIGKLGYSDEQIDALTEKWNRSSSKQEKEV